MLPLVPDSLALTVGAVVSGVVLLVLKLTALEVPTLPAAS